MHSDPTSPERATPILVATDLSPASESAVEYATTLAADEGARLVLAHVLDGHVMMPRELWRPPTEHERAAREERAARALQRLAHRFKRRGLRIDCIVVRGDPREEIARLARRVEAQLIVVAQARCYLGSAVETLLRDADVPVLVTPRSDGHAALQTATPAAASRSAH